MSGRDLRRSVPRAALVVALAAAVLGCGKSRAAEQRGAAGVRASAEQAAPRAPGLGFGLTLAADARSVEVEIRVTGPEVAQVRALRATRGWAGTNGLAAVQDLRVSDAMGSIGVGAPAEEEAFSLLPLARAPAGDELIVQYTARTGAEASRFALQRGAADASGSSGISGVGHSFVVRPALAAALPLALRFRAGSASTTFASSLDGRTDATVEDLAEAVYVAGAVQTAALASGDRAAIAFGSAIAGPAALDIAARARAGAARAFGLEDRGDKRAPRGVFVIGERGLGKEHDGAALGGTIALWLDAARPLDDGAKILIAHETLHEVFGGVLRVEAEGREATWFSEGFATHYARRLLFDQGLIEAAAFLADVARGDDERSEKGSPDDARAAGYGRGARYAAQIDAAVRARSRGKHTLDDVIRALTTLARKTPEVPLALSAFRGAVTAEVGEERERALWDGLAARTPPELPDDAFGPCFRRLIETRTVFELGFDAASLRSRPQLIRGTTPGSAAERAGVRDGAMVLKSSVHAGEKLDPGATVELLLTDPKGKKRVRYKPAQTQKTAVFVPQTCKR